MNRIICVGARIHVSDHLLLPFTYYKFETQIKIMTEIVIDKKKYVLVPEKEFKDLQKKAALKTKPEKLFSVENARTYSKKLIRKWAEEK